MSFRVGAQVKITRSLWDETCCVFVSRVTRLTKTRAVLDYGDYILLRTTEVFPRYLDYTSTAAVAEEATDGIQ